jgi:hypothetical protein
MPSRLWCVVIILFWLGANAWLLWQEVVPVFDSNRAPPFNIDIIDEVESTRTVDVAWNVFLNGQETYRTTTKVIPQKNDIFELRATMDVNRLKAPKGPEGGLLRLVTHKSSYFVERDGTLRELQEVFEFRTVLPTPITARLDGIVRDGNLHLHVTGHLAFLPQVEVPLEPISISSHPSLLTLLHPVNRIQGLRPGRTWRVPFLGVRGRAAMVNARVLPAVETLVWRNENRICLVVEYDGDEYEGRTWVEQSSGRVLQQEVRAEGQTWLMVREQ